MRRLLGVAVLLAALTAFVVAAAAADTGGTNRPFTGTLVGSAGAVLGPGCPLPFRTVSEATGTVSHLGLVSMTSSHCFVPPVTNADGRMTLVAANGDELYMTYEGISNIPGEPPLGAVVTATTDNVIVGGTGRFANATGDVEMIGYVLYTGLENPWPATWTLQGTISY